MTMRELHGDAAWLGAIERIVASQVDGRVDAGTHAAGRERLVRALASRGAPRPRPWRSMLAVVAGLGAGALYAMAARPWDLHCWVDGRGIREGYVRAAAGGSSVVFSDGSEVSLFAGARARLTSLDGSAPRLVLEGGHARAHFAESRQASWSLAAGPFTIVTAGAELDASWSDADQVLQVGLRHGSAVVFGPGAPEGFALPLGSRLTARGAAFESAPIAAPL